MWMGTQMGVVRTQHHPDNIGVRGEFADADFEVDIPDTVEIPVLVAAGKSRVRAASQVVLRLDERGLSGQEAYSTDGPPVKLTDSMTSG